MREGIFHAGLILLIATAVCIIGFGLYQSDLILIAVGALIALVAIILFSERRKFTL